MNIQHHEEPWKAIVMPSSLSIVVTIFLTLALASLVTYVLWFHASDIARYFSTGLQIQVANNSSDLTAARNAVDTSELAANISVFVFWFLIGGLCYSGVTTLWHGFVATRWNLESVITESYGGRFSTLVEIAARTGLRVLGLVLIGCVYLLVKLLMPWLVYWLYTMSHSRVGLVDIAALIGSIVAVALAVHLLTIGLRLLTLRVRLFS